MKKAIRRVTAVIISLLILCAGVTVSAEEPSYQSYFYVDGKIKSAPASIVPVKVLSGVDIGCGALKSPQDIHIHNDTVYIADADNNRVVVTDLDFKLIRVINEVTVNGQKSALVTPKGVFADDNYLYVADTGNARVLALNGDDTAEIVLEKPDDALYDQNRQFQPQKVLRDKNGYFYVLSLGTYEGAILYNSDGSFNSFYGSNRVAVTVSLMIEETWRKFMNKTQLSKVAKNIPQEYSGFDMDENGFVYTATGNSSDEVDQIKKLNPTGNNVWETGKNYGDTVVEWSGSTRVVTRFADVTIDGDVVSAIDSERGHIFQYSATDGRILSVTGNNGVQQGTFSTLTAVESFNGVLYVVDGAKCSITVFETTDYGKSVCEAMALHNDGLYDQAYEKWEQVLKYNGNMQLAYTGIGKALHGKGDYIEAMKYFKLGNDTEGYSVSFEAERKNLLRKNFIWILPLCVILIAVFLISGVVERKRKVDHASKKYKAWQYPFYIMMHPSDGFNDLRWTKRTSFSVASVILFFWLLSSIMREQLSAFLFSSSGAEKLQFNVWTQLLAMAGLFILFVIINWAVCTLFDGKGTMKNVYIYVAYSLLPMVFGNYLYTGLSHVFSLNEAAFLNILNTIFIVWTGLLLLRGLSVLHEYNLKQVVLSVVSTVFGIAIVIFLLLLVVSLFNKLGSFITSIISEMMLHSKNG